MQYYTWQNYILYMVRTKQESRLIHPYEHYRRSFLCRVPATHGEIGKAHGKYFAVCLLSANNARQRTPRRITYAVCIHKNARPTFCRVLPPHARESKASNAFHAPTEARGAVCRGFDFAVRPVLAVCRELWFAVCLA
jgi:hypothetical protein